MIKKLLTDLLGISTTQQATLTTTSGVLGAILTYSFGGWSEVFGFLLLAIVIDYVSGLAASIIEGKGLSSKEGFKGLFKKFFMILIVMLAHRIDILLGTNIIMTGAIYFYLANELISITENYGRIGLPLPNGVKQVIQVLKNKGEATPKDKDVQQ
ncbi:phage holin family protein [Paenibacillus sedimenti]|uniref:Phage holin family protein n=1 Tax=Paenibacillus sedimenti TaxID=2770274 RepID=A0A926KQ58_9BACL|nr:phage holin family protein [Paenibacillus sedimenti]MBD0381273.1 phage holin family protein [Paenibacillus sedimenti]